jgi:hypothetical protein
MPNWCNNELEVYGDIVRLKEFSYDCTYDVEGETLEFSFCGLVPEPNYEGYLSSSTENGMPDWYEWRVANWGTKWDTEALDISYGPDSLSISFDTAWGPPEAWAKAASRLYPDLRLVLTYSEPGMDFSGRITYQNGDIVSEETGDYKLFGIFEFDEEED